ncbi:MAG: T9SS type A sorting domain-containing protein [Flavobacteriales bacterium]|nr:T9SS type A sorting domain-containing protein [Flavobacteriales bacterium]
MNKVILYVGTALFGLFAFPANAQMIWDDFDNPELIIYDYFDGVGFDQGYANPSTSGINSSAICAQYNRNPGVLYDVIVINPAGGTQMNDLSGYVDGSQNMTVKVYSPAAGITVQITLEDNNIAGPTNYPSGRHSEYQATTSVANEWETLTFELTNQPDLSITNTQTNQLVLLFDPGSLTNTVFLFDDLMGPEFTNPCDGVTPDPAIGDDFECQRNVSYNFVNGTLGLEANPAPDAVNGSDGCARFTKFIPPTNDGAFGGDLSFPFSSSTFSTAAIDLYSPAGAQEFIIIFQDATNNDVAQTNVLTAASAGWVTYEADLGLVSSGTTIAKYVLLLNPATDTEDYIFLDNFRFGVGSINVEEGQVQRIEVYPVPVADQFNIGTPLSNATIEVRDMKGSLVWSQSQVTSSNCVVDSSTWTEGVYMLTVRQDNGDVLIRKIVK